PLVHLMFANLKEWAKGTYHGLRPKHLQSYLDEYVFRSNRRHNRPSAFKTLLQLATSCQPVTYKMLIAPEAGG
ncbi:MAG: transposase, partial [Hyphomicrobiaceae bacterium]|nr:transposase [Hyphomicrobiaceae bacterium]